MKSGNIKLKGATFIFRGRDATMRDVPRLLDGVNGELEKEFERFGEWDTAMFTNHYRAAYILDPARAVDLLRRYELQVTVQDWILKLMAYQNVVSNALEQVFRGELQEGQFAQLKEMLQQAANHLLGIHTKARTIL